MRDEIELNLASSHRKIMENVSMQQKDLADFLGRDDDEDVM